MNLYPETLLFPCSRHSFCFTKPFLSQEQFNQLYIGILGDATDSFWYNADIKAFK